MNANDHPLWSSQPNLGEPTVDFSHFFNYDMSLSFDSQPAENGSPDTSRLHQQDLNMMDNDFQGSAIVAEGSGDGHDRGMHGGEGMNGLTGNLDLMEMRLQHSLQQQFEAQAQATAVHAQIFQQQLRQHHMNKVIPPTPSSLDLQDGDMTPQMYQHLCGLKDDMIFTPLVSPAVTPLDTHFTHLPEYTMAPGYFSPLTSPALQAQRPGPYSFLSNTVPSSKPSPPAEVPESPVSSKKPSSSSGRRKSAANSRTSSRVVRDSPSMKPQRRKAPMSIAPAAELAQSIAQQHARTQSFNKSATSDTTASNSGRDSSSESISPEPMPESLMAPPPTPAPKVNGVHARQLASSQSEVARHVERMGPPSTVKPVTPAILMRLPKSSIPADAAQMPSAEASLMMLDSGQMMDSIVSKSRSGYSSTGNGSQVTSPVDGQATPTMHPSNRTPARTPRGTPHLKPSNSNSTSNSQRSSRNHSPVAIQPSSSTKLSMSSVSTPRLTPKLQPSNSSSSISSRKRSIPASPALIPKISPNIKPLLNNVSLLLDSPASIHTAASLLLASKSNYQNIVEGNSSSLGLSYPEELSTGLTSKRTSHKIAEQGRRNRINTALQELNSLLPKQGGDGTEKGYTGGESQDGGSGGSGGGKGGAANQGTSKAVTVERAIAYIRALKGELEDAKNKLKLTEQKLGSQESGGSDHAAAAAKVKTKSPATRLTDKSEDQRQRVRQPSLPEAESSMGIQLAADPDLEAELTPGQVEDDEDEGKIGSPNGGEVIMLD